MANHGPPGRKRFSDGGGGPHDDQGWRKKPRFDSDVPPATLRVLIRNSEAGGIIGKGGENIKRLRKQYDCQVVLPDSAGAPERVMTMMGTIHSCVGVLSDVLEGLGSDYRGGGGHHDASNKELQVLIPQPFMGTIIGTGGSKIKELRTRTQATIKIFSDPMPGSNERSVQLVGSKEQIVECVQHFLDDISKKEPREPIYLYEPHNPQFDSPPFVDTVRGGGSRGRGNAGFNRGRGRGRGGGYGGDSGGWRGQGGRGGGARGGRGSRNQYNGSSSRGGFSYGSGSGQHQSSQSYQPSGPMNPPPMGSGGSADTSNPPVGYGTPQQQPPVQPPPVGYTAPPTQATPPAAVPGMAPPNPSSQPPPAVGGSPQVFPVAPPSQGSQAPPPQFGGGTQNQYPKPVASAPPTGGSGTAGAQSQQVTIPVMFADAILGPGGSRLHHIKSRSSCDITLEPTTPGSTERIITITGSPSGIQFAQQLMQNSVRQQHNV